MLVATYFWANGIGFENYTFSELKKVAKKKDQSI